MTAEQVFNDVKALLDEYSNKGVLISEDKTKDIELKSILFISKGQRELYYQGNYFKKFSYIGTMPKNELDVNFDLNEYIGEQITTLAVDGKAYHFSVDNTAIVKLQELIGDTWTDIEVINATSANGFTSYKGLINTSRKVRLSFEGPTYYRYTNVAIFNYPYAEAPDYDAWIKVDLPDDFMNINDIIEESGFKYIRKGTYNLEGQRDLYVTYDFDGELRLTYKPVPPRISALTDELVIDEIHAEALAFYVAAKVAATERPQLVTYFEELFNESINRVDRPVQSGFAKIEDVYQIGRLGGS